METETHPFKPFMPPNAKLLMLGTFPPSAKRWCMEFYYPNFTNDMWRIFGICFFADKQHFILQEQKCYDLNNIIPFLKHYGTAIYDTCTKICRTQNTASDKDLLVIERTDFDTMLHQLPQCKAVITAGQLATKIFCEHYGIAEPKVNEYSTFELNGREIRLYRMPSSSRAYPMKTELKAATYDTVFEWLWPDKKI